jgi:hypothetical protein
MLKLRAGALLGVLSNWMAFRAEEIDRQTATLAQGEAAVFSIARLNAELAAREASAHAQHSH